MNSEEYIPSEKDLKDFEEFEKERDRFDSQDYVKICSDLYELHCGNQLKKCMKETVMDILVCNLSTFSDIKNSSMRQRLCMTQLFGYDEREIVKMISPDLSESDIDCVINNVQYPYLWKGMNIYFSDSRIDQAIEARNASVRTKSLPFIMFNEIHPISDKIMLYARKELIANTTPENRPLFFLRNLALRKGTERGYWDYPEPNFIEKAKVSIKRFLSLVLEECQFHQQALLYQFNITTIKSCTSGMTRFSIPIQYIPVIEEYFNVEFTNTPELTKKSTIMYIDTVKRESDYMTFR